MRLAVGLVSTAIVAAAALFAFSERHTAPLAPSSPAVKRMQVSTLATSAAGLVAGGETGKILYSGDKGVNWTESTMPEKLRYAQINEITFANDKEGMATGHEGLVLYTQDGGKSWSEIAFDEADGSAAASSAKMPDGQWLVVGSFGKAMRTADAGKTWEKIAFEGLEDKHLYKIISNKDKSQWLLLGESGTIFRSADAGQSWNTIPPFYNGSFYGGVALDEQRWVIYGMRGNVFYSSNAGVSWTKSQMPVIASMFGHTVDDAGHVVLVGLNGVIVKSRDGGQNFELVRKGPQPALLDISPAPEGWWIGTERGIKHYSEDFLMDGESTLPVPDKRELSAARAAAAPADAALANTAASSSGSATMNTNTTTDTTGAAK